jgi:tripartite-type tricarboxylate transporter receptor subunit TctC
VPAAQAQAPYPNKPVRILVGFSAGGATDVIARLLAKEMTEDLGQSVVVENKPGAGSNIAAESVVRSAPDGYTLFMMAVTNAINQTLYPNLKFDVIKDFSPIGLAAKVPNLMVVNLKVPANSVQELIDYAKKNPGKLNYASSASTIYLQTELFKSMAYRAHAAHDCRRIARCQSPTHSPRSAKSGGRFCCALSSVVPTTGCPLAH